jgi:hypothetical protein
VSNAQCSLLKPYSYEQRRNVTKQGENMSNVLNTEQAAECLGLTVKALRNRLTRGIGPDHIKLASGALQFALPDLERWRLASALGDTPKPKPALTSAAPAYDGAARVALVAKIMRQWRDDIPGLEAEAARLSGEARSGGIAWSETVQTFESAERHREALFYLRNPDRCAANGIPATETSARRA